MEMESPAAARACKRTASPDSGQQAEKRCFVVQDDAAAAVGGLVRQGTFTKEDVGRGSEQIFIPVEHKENASRREALRIRFAEREQSRRSARKLTEARGTAAPRRPATKDESTATGRSVRARQAPVSGVSGVSPLQRQGTFTVDEEAGRADGQSGDLMDPGDDGGQAQQQVVNEVASDNNGTVRDGDAVAAEVAALRASVAALRRGERVARERAARDAGRTRAALQDVHGRLAATRAALQAEKEALLHKLTDREALWRQERDRAQAQVRALETEARALRAQLSSKQADAVRKVTAAEAELRRAAHDQEAALRAQLADMARQRDSLQAQLRDRTLPERPASPASPAARPQEEWQRVALAQRRELQQGRKRQAQLEAQLEAQLREARRPQDALREADLKADLARALHDKDEERRRDAAEAARKHEALEAQLRDALRELRQQREAASRRPATRSGAGKARALALESQVDGETRTGPDGSGEARGAPGPEPLRTTPATPPNARCRPHQREQRGGAAVGRKRRRWAEDEEEDDDKRTLNEATHEDNDDDENENQRRSLLREVERLREHNTALRESLRVRRRRSPRPPGPQLHRVLKRSSRRRERSVVQQQQQQQPGAAPPSDTNAGVQAEEGLMRHFHRLISLEPVSEADEYPSGSHLGLGGPLGGPLGDSLGGSLMGSESPLSSGPSSLSPTPGIGDVWNDMAAGCVTPSTGVSSGASSPGGESLVGSSSPSPEQLGPHAVLYWQLMRDHLQLQRAYQQLQQLQASSRNKDRQTRAKLEAQVYDLKRALSRTNRGARAGAQAQHGALADALQDVVELRQREQSLNAELAELRDQNELLEFRLLELEGIADKSSVCSGTRDVCTDTESDTVTEDSGLLSLGASDDGDESAAVRERLALLAGTLVAEEDRGCLQRALQLLDTYQQQLHKQDTTKASPPAKPPNQRIVATVLPYTDLADDALDAKQNSREDFRRKQEFFNQMQRLDRTCGAQKSLKQADCLQESGIFEAEDGVGGDLASVATQTDAAWTCASGCQPPASSPLEVPVELPTQEPEVFSSLPAFGSAKTTPPAQPGALSAEIQKLSQIRERFEEQGSVTKLKQTPPAQPAAVPPQLQHKLRELEFFQTRAALLEDKLAELERCSDPELRGCARLLERVAALERQAREAREAADLLVRRNRDLEEERCELEEAENDTRLRCQHLEVEVVQLREREGALEVELGRARRSLSAAHQLQGRLEMALQSLETRNFELEEAECELRASIAAVESALPAIVAFHLAHYKSYLQKRNQRTELPLPVPMRTMRSTAVSTEDDDDHMDDSTDAVVDSSVDTVDGGEPTPRRNESEVLERLAQLVAAEKDMHQKIAFLEQKESAFQETLAAADGLWTEMELNYKRRLSRAEEAEEELRRKVRRLEDSEGKLRQAVADQTALSDRVHELEAQERALLTRIRGLELEKQAVAEEADRFHEDARTARTALCELQARVDGPLAEELAAERRRAQELAEELRSKQDALSALEHRTNTEISALKTQIATGERSLQDQEVTCAELREEVDTLEEAVSSLRSQLTVAYDKAEHHLFQMESALAARDRLAEQVRLARLERTPPPALEDEMAAAERAEQCQPEEDDDAPAGPEATAEAAVAPEAAVAEATPAPPAVSLFRKSLQAFRNSEMMMLKATKPPTLPKPVPKKETVHQEACAELNSKPFASLPAMPSPGPLAPAGAKRTPPPLPPKTAVSAKWPRADSSAAR